jgi:hypothetical protein
MLVPGHVNRRVFAEERKGGELFDKSRQKLANFQASKNLTLPFRLT